MTRLGIEQDRRDFKASNPTLYSYIAAHENAAVLKSAGDNVSGARDAHGAASRLWSMAGRWRARADKMFADSMEQASL